jgi:hypothetical protein
MKPKLVIYNAMITRTRMGSKETRKFFYVTRLSYEATCTTTMYRYRARKEKEEVVDRGCRLRMALLWMMQNGISKTGKEQRV